MFRKEWDRLLLAARGGNSPALGRLLELSQDDLRQAATRAGGRGRQDHAQGEDVFADSIVTVLREIGSLRATNYVGFRFWFASIARNQVRRALRREHKRSQPLLGTEPEACEERAPAPRGPPALGVALLHLPRSQTSAYVLREGLGLSWKAIGFVLARRPPAAARLVHYRAAARVRGRLAQDGSKRARAGSIHAGACSPSESR